VLDNQTDKTLFGIKSLIEGAIQVELKNQDFAEQV
jgi:hypothetical protein